MTEKELLALKQEITGATSEIAKLEGQKELLMKQLKDTYGVDSIKKADAKVAKLEKEIADLDKQIDAETEELENQLTDEQDTGSEE